MSKFLGWVSYDLSTPIDFAEVAEFTNQILQGHEGRVYLYSSINEYYGEHGLIFATDIADEDEVDEYYFNELEEAYGEVGEEV